MGHKPIKYAGEDIDVFWDAKLCIHVGECTRAKGDLFVGGRKPWCQPDLASEEEVLEVITRCPSGALTCQTTEGLRPETASTDNEMHVSQNGPLYLRGELDIEGAAAESAGLNFRAALCRCGQSKNKPFCDNSHTKSGFEDSGAVGERGRPLEHRGGALRVNPTTDGPLVINGNLTIRSGNGRVAWHGTQTALCRCGCSGNKPFCDGSHKKVGFRSDPPES